MQFQQIPINERGEVGLIFDRLQQRALRSQLWARLFRRAQPMPVLDQTRAQLNFKSQRGVGIQSVALAQIRGSVGRSIDFDRDFRPLKGYLRDRWVNVAMALFHEVVLPAVDLIKVNDEYFVVDGHHRISVARYQNKVAIDANVVEWKGEAVCGTPTPSGLISHSSRPLWRLAAS